MLTLRLHKIRRSVTAPIHVADKNEARSAILPANAGAEKGGSNETLATDIRGTEPSPFYFVTRAVLLAA